MWLVLLSDKKEGNKMKKQILYTSIGILLLALFTVGGTYAFYALVVFGNKSVNTNSSKFIWKEIVLWHLTRVGISVL